MTRWLRAGLAVVLVVPVSVAVTGSPAAAAEVSLVQELHPDEQIEAGAGARMPASRLAQTDPELLGRTDATPVPVLVKLDHDPVATYAGEVDGYPATSPAVTGRRLAGGGVETRYEAYLAEREARFLDALAEVAPAAQVRQRLRTVYGGVAVSVPADLVDEVLALEGVAAVQADEERPVLTDASPAFTGAETLYPQLGGAPDAGRGTIIGVLDTGGWPEHPSFADLGNLDPPPGPDRACEFGEAREPNRDPSGEAREPNQDPGGDAREPNRDPSGDAREPDQEPGGPDPDGAVFECDNKLIGGQAFLETYHAERGDEQFPGTARDGNGHGTHVASTAAGNVLDSATVLGAEHGPVNGIAPGAWIMHYRVCGIDSCFVSDSAAAVQQAIRDGVDVINFSIGGGAEPFLDPVSLAFLDAYASGVLPVASAGNAGPEAGTINHVAPWITTVAASTQAREFGSTLTLTAGDGAVATFDGVSITGGVPELPVVMAADPPYGDALCRQPAPAGLFDGVIVACERGEIARVLKGFHVQEGGAAGMVLFNPSLADTTADTHWLPTIQLADGTDFAAVLAEHDEVTGTFTDGEKRDGQANVMAAFSSRGPGGFGLKPDLTAPGVQILAGDVPIEGDPAAGGGPAGELFQAIGGTSMASPHVAGAALLLRALRPEWTPGQIRSALMTTARQDLVKEDLTTPADPFDYGAGHLDLARAGSPGLALDETATRMVALGDDLANAVHLNLPQVSAPVMPGRLATTRTVQNVTDQVLSYRVEVDQPAQGEVRVTPEELTLGAGRTQQLSVTITADTASPEQQFAAIRLVPAGHDLPEQRLPVAFLPRQAEVSLASTCDPDETDWLRTTTCTVSASNHAYTPVTVDLWTSTDRRLLVTGADGAVRRNGSTVELTGAELEPVVPGSPTLTPGTHPAGAWVSLADLGVAANPVGSASILNFTVPELTYGHATYDRIGVTTDGYAIPGGGVGADVVAPPPGIPDTARPNNLLAPFWSDLDGRGAPGIRSAVLDVGGAPYLAVEWEVYAAGTTGPSGLAPDQASDPLVFQLWLGLRDEEQITFAYDPERLPTSPHPFEVGAEDVLGTTGATLGPDTAPTGDLAVTSTDLTPGATLSYEVTLRGIIPGTGTVTTTMTSPALPGTTVVTSRITVHPRT